MIDNELGRTYREKRGHGMRKNSRNLTGSVEKRKISGRIPAKV
jgi:hypothetical protein